MLRSRYVVLWLRVADRRSIDRLMMWVLEIAFAVKKLMNVELSGRSLAVSKFWFVHQELAKDI